MTYEVIELNNESELYKIYGLRYAVCNDHFTIAYFYRETEAEIFKLTLETFGK